MSAVDDGRFRNVGSDAMQLILRDLHLPMRHAFTIAHGTTTLQHNLSLSSASNVRNMHVPGNRSAKLPALVTYVVAAVATRAANGARRGTHCATVAPPFLRWSASVLLVSTAVPVLDAA